MSKRAIKRRGGEKSFLGLPTTLWAKLESIGAICMWRLNLLAPLRTAFSAGYCPPAAATAAAFATESLLSQISSMIMMMTTMMCAE